MKLITEEQRNSLIEDCRWAIEGLEISIRNGGSDTPHHLVSELLRQEIALESLSAEAMVATEKHEISNMQATGMYIRAWPVSRRRNMVEGYTIRLYTALPVPVIKPDQLEGVQVSVDVSTCDSDAGNRIFGRVTSVTESKGETVLLVEETSRNFN